MRTNAPPDYGPHEIAGSSLADVILRSGRNSKLHRTARRRQSFARRRLLHPYIEYIDRRLSIGANNRPDGVQCGCPAGLSRVTATCPLRKSCPSHTPRIPLAYPSDTPHLPVLWACSVRELHKTRRNRPAGPNPACAMYLFLLFLRSVEVRSEKEVVADNYNRK